MAVGLGPLPVMHPVKGFRLGTASAGIKTPGRRDVVVMELAADANVAGVFTKNAFCAAPVTVAKRHLAAQTPRYLLVNTGNANAGTGAQGIQDAETCCAQVATHVGVEPQAVLPFSTGVIGEPLPVDKISQAIPQALAALSETGWEDAAHGILTTDTLPKGASVQLEWQGQLITLTGIAKGSGMIKPNMATMLGFVATDARIEPALLQPLLREAVECSFNRITVDSDTSTNDACMLVATGASGITIDTTDAELLERFRAALCQLMLTLAHAIVRDGEGATKFVAVQVEQAASQQEALDVAYTVAHSPLVKTALYASDPNWGRILAAVGRAGIEDMKVDDIRIYLDDVCIVAGGGRAATYTEEQGAAVMAREEITIRILLGRGEAAETVWTSDLSNEYVRINAEYRS